MPGQIPKKMRRLVLPLARFSPGSSHWGLQVIAFHSSVPFLVLFLLLEIVTPSVSRLQPFTILPPFKAKLKVISLMGPWDDGAVHL